MIDQLPLSGRGSILLHGVFPPAFDKRIDRMEALNHLMTVICVIAVALTWYFVLEVRRSSRALRAELERPGPGNISRSDEPVARATLAELRRERRSRAIHAAISAGIVVLSTFAQAKIDQRMPDGTGATARAQSPHGLTNQEAMILVVLSWLLVGTAGLFLFFATRFLLLTAIAQHHRNPERRLNVRGAFRLSSYDERGRNCLRRAGTSGLLSLASLTVFFIVAITLQSVQ